jgi:hypothetical protein
LIWSSYIPAFVSAVYILEMAFSSILKYLVGSISPCKLRVIRLTGAVGLNVIPVPVRPTRHSSLLKLSIKKVALF